MIGGNIASGGRPLKPPKRNLADLFRFSKPKTPGYEISRDYYLTVFAATSALPTPRQIATPKGTQGTVMGLLAPMSAGSKEDLERPMGRGIYAVASADHKTVLKLMVMPIAEAAFDPNQVLNSPMGYRLQDEVRNRIAATWHLMQITFEAFDPKITPSLDFLLLIARQLALQTDGLIADPICQRYLLPEKLIADPRIEPDLDAREHIVVDQTGNDTHTRGLVKFALPELKIGDLLDAEFDLAEKFLLNLCQTILKGNLLVVEAYAGPFFVTHGADAGAWESIPSYELIPPKGMSPGDALRQWAGL